jgi:hypothetical protein
VLVKHKKYGCETLTLTLCTDYSRESDLTLRNQQGSEDYNGEIQLFVSYLSRVLPNRIREEITKHVPGQNQVPSADILDRAVRNCLNQTGSEWHKVHSVQSVENQDLACQSGDNDLNMGGLSYPNTPSSSLDQSLSRTAQEQEQATLRHQNELVLPSWTWANTFPDGYTEPASIHTGMSSYGSADLLDCSRTWSTSDGLPWSSDTLQWTAGDPHDLIILD